MCASYGGKRYRINELEDWRHPQQVPASEDDRRQESKTKK